MGKRGRPPYPDILTPREWEVLALLREGLTNEQIAQRLGISHNAAKFHVSEILSKLGVSSRQEAAAWQPGRRPWWATGLALARWPLVRLKEMMLSPGAKAALSGVARVALVGSVAVGLALGIRYIAEQKDVQEQQSGSSTLLVAPTPTPQEVVTPAATALPYPYQDRWGLYIINRPDEGGLGLRRLTEGRADFLGWKDNVTAIIRMGESIHNLNIDTGKMTEVLSLGPRAAMTVLSPQKTLVAYTEVPPGSTPRDEGVEKIALKIARLDTGATRTVAEGAFNDDIWWSPDGRTLAYLWAPKYPVSPGGYTLFVLYVDSNEPPRALGQADSLAWAPDSQRIALSRCSVVGGGFQTGLLVARTDGSVHFSSP